MSVTNMKELCLYVEQARRNRAAEHRRKHSHEKLCGGLTDLEYNKMVIRQKISFPKAKKFTHSKMWKNTHKKFDLQQLNIINKKLK